jgi:hypothetical protein
MRFTIPDKMRGFLFNPSESFWKVAEEDVRDSLLYFLIIAVFYAILSTVMTVMEVFNHPFLALFGFRFGIDRIELLLLKFLAVLVFSWLFALVYSLLLHFWVWLIGGKKGIYQTVRSVLYSLTALMLIGWVPDIGPPVGLIWTVVVGIIGIEELQHLSRWWAAAAVIMAILTGLVVFPALFRDLLMEVILTGPPLIGPY